MPGDQQPEPDADAAAIEQPVREIKLGPDGFGAVDEELQIENQPPGRENGEPGDETSGQPLPPAGRRRDGDSSRDDGEDDEKRPGEVTRARVW
ncbi:hypothetical protein [Amycolatopsis sp. WGS_07]|uniref:hypothetical protein n=1 Tax=Amycolatopsis sp. WGS_07 TaxID=3076764 RepID=UPI0038730E53